MNALFIGRFQPFHKGHSMLLQNIGSQYDEIIIGIGSSQYSSTVDNLFSEDERKKMIAKSLDKIGINNYRIVLIPDILMLSFLIILSPNSYSQKKDISLREHLILKKKGIREKRFEEG